MKKIMNLMLGLSLLSGIAVFAQEKPAAPAKSTAKSTKTKSTKPKTTKPKTTKPKSTKPAKTT